jgi:hypothetical protein
VLTWLAISALSMLGITGPSSTSATFTTRTVSFRPRPTRRAAGAQDLPNERGHQHRLQLRPAPARRTCTDMPNVATTVTTKCLTSTQISCKPVNALVVTQKADVATIFLKVLGIKSISIGAKSTASMKGGTAFPLDVMIVLDRTGSMCQPCEDRQRPRRHQGILGDAAVVVAWRCCRPRPSDRCPPRPARPTTSTTCAVVPPSDFRTSDTGPVNTNSISSRRSIA